MTVLSDVDVARMVETTEAAACADLLRAAPPEWRSVAEETDAGWILCAPAIDMLLFNRVVGCGVKAPARQFDLDALIGRLRAAGVRNYGVQLSPAAEPTDVTDWLAEAGLSPRDRWTKVFRSAGAAAPVATDLRIEATGPEHAGVFAEVTTSGFGMPPEWRPWIAATVGRPQWRHYLAWNGHTPVAGAALFIDGHVGWLGVASTLPAARRRGAQSALMAKRLQDGWNLGCHWFVTETGEDTPARPNPSLHNMLRAGFRVAYHRQNFMPPRA
jgi:hypothetical protein